MACFGIAVAALLVLILGIVFLYWQDHRGPPPQMQPPQKTNPTGYHNPRFNRTHDLYE